MSRGGRVLRSNPMTDELLEYARSRFPREKILDVSIFAEPLEPGRPVRVLTESGQIFRLPMPGAPEAPLAGHEADPVEVDVSSLTSKTPKPKLIEVAELLGLSTSGTKRELLARIRGDDGHSGDD